MSLTEAQIQRYSRHILLPEMGGIGQKRLMESSVLIVCTTEGEGAAAVAATYLVAGGVGCIGWCPGDARESPAAGDGSLAGLTGLYDPAGPMASAAALNPDTRFEVLARSEFEENAGAATGRFNLVILSGRDVVLEQVAARFETCGKPVLCGTREGWSAAVVACPGNLDVLEFSPEAGETPLPAAPAEGVLGAMLASFALRALLKGEKSVGSTVLARFDLSRGHLKKVSR